MTVGQKFNPYKLFVGSFIPNALMRYKGISSTAKLTWARLAQYAGENGMAWPSQKTLAEEIGVTERQINFVLKELEKEGFIKRIAPKGINKLLHKTTRYFFLWHKCFEKSIHVADVISDTEVNFSSRTEVNFSSNTEKNFRRRESEKENQFQENHPIRSEVSDITSTRNSSLKEKVRKTSDSYPDWFPQEEFFAYKEMREKMRKPLTEKAEELAIKRLASFQDKGYEPKEILEQSILNGWQGLFPPLEVNGKFWQYVAPRRVRCSEDRIEELPQREEMPPEVREFIRRLKKV